MELKELICELAEASGPSGYEDDIRRRAERLLQELCDEVKTDVMGNLIALRRSAEPNARTVMLEAHMDEVGLMVTGYDGGSLRFGTLGSVDARVLPALEVSVLAEPPLYGVIDVLPPHVLSAEEREKPLEVEKLRIDTGLSADAVRARVPLGTPVVFTTACRELGETRLCAKSLDDRCCMAAILRALELLPRIENVNVAVLFAVQEEVGGRGAVTGAYSVQPEAAIAVDVTHAATIGASSDKTFALGGGPAVGVGPNMTRSISRRLLELCETLAIPCQTEVLSGRSGTDAWPIQISREGIATGLISVPLRYMHTPVEVIDVRDVDATARLLAAWVEDCDREAR